jgi:protocatechuate 3,4-dioxygenase beta subunit
MGEAAEVEAAPCLDGTFRFDGLPPGRYLLAASHPRRFTRRLGFTLEEGGSAGPFEIVLKPGGALRVRVRGAAGVPLREQPIEVRASTDLAGGRPDHEGRTDAEGQVLFDHLAPGPYEVRWAQGDRASRRVTVTKAGEVEVEPAPPERMRMATIAPGATVEVVFESSCGIAGTVIGPEGAPLAHVIVRLRPVELRGEGYRHEQANTDREGRFALRDVAPGDYWVDVQVTGARLFVATSGRVTLEEGRTLEEVVRVRPNFVSGRITRADTGAPFARDPGSGMWAQAQARRVEIKDGRVAKWLEQAGTAFATDDGRYELVGLEPGSYWIWFPAPDPGYADATVLIEFGGGRRDGVDVALAPQKLATLRLRVLEEDGSPATGLYFSLRTPDGTWRTVHARGGANGLYTMRVPEGEQVVSASRAGFDVEVAATLKAGETVEREARLAPLPKEEGPK